MAELKTSLILQLVDKLSGPAARARAALLRVQKTAGKIDDFIKQKKAVLKTSAAYETAQLETARLAKQLKNTENPSKKLRDEFNRTSREAGNLKRKLNDENSALKALRSDLRRAGVDTKQLQHEQKRLAHEIETLTRKTRLLTRAQHAVRAAGNATTRTFNRLKPSATAVKIATLGVVGSVTMLANSFIRTGAQFEKYETTLRGLTGSSDEARAAMDWVSEFARTTPAELDGVMEAFIALKTRGMDPMDGTLRDLVDGTSKLGFSQENLMGIITQLGQAYSKGKLQQEDAMIIMERGLPVWDLLGKATGRASEEIQALASKGLIGRKSIKLLIQTIGEDSRGASNSAAKTWNGLMSNISDAWTRFKKMVVDAGFFNYLKNRLTELKKFVNDGFKSGKFVQIARDVSDGFVQAFRVIENVIKAVYKGLKDGSIKKFLIEIKNTLIDIGQAAKTIGAVGRFFGIGVSAEEKQQQVEGFFGRRDASGNLLKQQDPFALKQDINGSIKIEVSDDRVNVKQIRSDNENIELVTSIYNGRAMNAL